MSETQAPSVRRQLLVVLLLVVALLVSGAGRTEAFHPCALSVTPGSARHFSPGDLFIGSVEVECPAGAATFDIYALAAFSGAAGCPDDLQIVFLQPSDRRVACLQSLTPGSAPIPTLAGVSAPAASARFELVRTPWPTVIADRVFYWGVCVTEPGVPLVPGGDLRCVTSRLTQPSARGFSIVMPVLPGDTQNNFFGIWPFAVHGSGHTYDGGHPGWDVEFAAGASVRAAADGTVQSVLIDVNDPSKRTVQIEHPYGGQRYRTVYTNVEDPTVAPGAPVTTGEPLGMAGRSTSGSGDSQIVYYMTHFQLDELTSANPIVNGVSNPYAISPEPYLTPEGRALFQRIWGAVAYNSELTQPFPTNPRTGPYPFPITRAWTLQNQPAGSALPARIEFRYEDPATDPVSYVYDFYTLFDGAGRAVESGSVRVRPRPRPYSTIDFQPRDGEGRPSGPPRSGVYEVVSSTLRIDWGPPGAPRPADLSSAAVYTTE